MSNFELLHWKRRLGLADVFVLILRCSLVVTQSGSSGSVIGKQRASQPQPPQVNSSKQETPYNRIGHLCSIT